MFPGELRIKPGHVKKATDCSCSSLQQEQSLALITHLNCWQLSVIKTLQEKLQMAEIGCKCRVLAFLLHFWKHTQNSEFQLNFVSSSSVLPLRQSHNSCYLLKLCTSVVRGNLKCSVHRNTLLKAGLIRVWVEIWANLSEKAKFCPAKQAELKFQEKWKRKQKMENATCNLSLTVWNDPCFNHPGRKKNLRRVHVNVWQQGVIWKEFYCAIVGELSPEFVWGQSQKVWAFIYGFVERGLSVIDLNLQLLHMQVKESCSVAMQEL